MEEHLKQTTLYKSFLTDIYQKCGVYQLKRNEYHLRYIGQAGRTFKDRYREHIQATRTNRHTSKYAQHILDTGHEYGPIEENMEVVQTAKRNIYLIH